MKPYTRMLVVLACMIATALILQGAFDTSDHEKSERSVRGYRGANGPSVEERVAAAAPGGAWSSEITHSCRGVVRVTYAAPGGTFAFDYDLPGHVVHPANVAAERILGAIGESARPAPGR